jgi:hypothetical protein
MSAHNAVLSANRFLGFMIGPLLGILVDRGENREIMFYLALVSCGAGSIALAINLVLWNHIGQKFVQLIIAIQQHGYKLRVFFKAEKEIKTDIALDKRNLDIRLLLASIIITGFTLPVPFVVNNLALGYEEYRSSILQLTGLVSGTGSLILNFYANPHLAVMEQNNSLGSAYYSLHLGKILGLSILSPALIIISYIA